MFYTTQGIGLSSDLMVKVTRSPKAVTNVLIFSLVLTSVFIVKNFLGDGFLHSPKKQARSLIVGLLPIPLLITLSIYWEPFGLEHLWLFFFLAALWIGSHSLSKVLGFWTEEDQTMKEGHLKFVLNLTVFSVCFVGGYGLLAIAIHSHDPNLLLPLTNWLGVPYGS